MIYEDWLRIFMVMKCMNRKYFKGFTLAEMLVVILIIGIVAMALAPLMLPPKKKKTADKTPHGVFECYYENGRLHSYLNSSASNGPQKNKHITADGKSCEYTLPDANFYRVQVVGSGGRGGDDVSKINSTVDTNTTKSGTISLLVDGTNPKAVANQFQKDVEAAGDWLKENGVYDSNSYIWSYGVGNGGRVRYTVTSPMGVAGTTGCRILYNTSMLYNKYCMDNCSSAPATKECVESGCSGIYEYKGCPSDYQTQASIYAPITPNTTSIVGSATSSGTTLSVVGPSGINFALPAPASGADWARGSGDPYNDYGATCGWMSYNRTSCNGYKGYPYNCSLSPTYSYSIPQSCPSFSSFLNTNGAVNTLMVFGGGVGSKGYVSADKTSLSYQTKLMKIVINYGKSGDYGVNKIRTYSNLGNKKLTLTPAKTSNDSSILKSGTSDILVAKNRSPEYGTMSTFEIGGKKFENFLSNSDLSKFFPIIYYQNAGLLPGKSRLFSSSVSRYDSAISNLTESPGLGGYGAFPAMNYFEETVYRTFGSWGGYGKIGINRSPSDLECPDGNPPVKRYDWSDAAYCQATYGTSGAIRIVW